MTAPTVIQYARHHGLAIDHRNDDLFQHLGALLPQQPLQIDKPLPDLEFPTLDEVLADEKLQVSSEAGKLLRDCIKPPSETDWDALMKPTRTATHLKFEVPMLVADHEKEMKWFRSSISLDHLINDFIKIQVKEHHSADEGSILAECKSLADDFTRDVSSERLEISKKAMQFLASTLRDKWREEDTEAFMEQNLRFKRVMPENGPGDFDLLQLPELDTEPQSEESVDLDNLNDHIEHEIEQNNHELAGEGSEVNPFAEERITITSRPPSSINMSVCPNLIIEPSGSVPRKKKRNQIELKTEDSSSTSFLGEIYCAGNNKRRKMLLKPSTDEQVADILAETKRDSEDEFPEHNRDRDNAFCNDPQTVEDQVESSSSHQIPSLNFQDLRMRLPRLDQIEVPIPMKRLSNDDLLSMVLDCASERVASPDYLQEARKLNWSPFPKEWLHFEVNEKIDDSGNWERFIKMPEKVVSSEQLLWKEPGLKILNQDDSESDEELTYDMEIAESMQLLSDIVPAPTSANVDITPDSVTDPYDTEMKQEIDSAASADRHSRAQTQMKEILKHTPSRHETELKQVDLLSSLRTNKSHSSILTNIREKLNSPSVLDSHFSTASSLSTFLDLRGKKFKKPELSHFQRNSKSTRNNVITEIPDDPIMTSQTTSACADATHTTSKQPVQPNTTQEPNTNHIVTPEAKILSTASTIFCNYNLLKNRELIKQIENNQDQLQVIYRDLNSYPDIILNPQTCIIYDNIQSLTQKTLPGQPRSQTRNFLHDKILKLANEYERIFILMAISVANESVSLSPLQRTSMAEFSAFCASLAIPASSGTMTISENTILPIWIPLHQTSHKLTPDPIAVWTWTLITRYALARRRQQHQHQHHDQWPPLSSGTTPVSLPLHKHDTQHNRPTTGNEPPPPPVNTTFELIFLDDETLWERFLRKAGLNPMAAQVILASLEKGDQQQRHTKEDVNGRTWGLPLFVRMSPRERIERFSSTLGLKAVNKVNDALEGKH